MRVELILPIARLRGKINSKSPFYFKTINGKTFVQRCPNRSIKTATPAQTAVGMEGLNTLLYGWKKFRKYGAKYLDALKHRDWMYSVEVADFSEYAGYDLT